VKSAKIKRFDRLFGKVIYSLSLAFLNGILHPMKSKSIPENTCKSAQNRVIAVIPCLNEERFIGSMVLKTKKFVDQVIVVDDGSSDRTAEVAEAAGAVVLKHEVNEGKSAALNTAFKKIREIGVRAVVVIDGDAQHEPAEIPRLIQPVLDGEADMVVGSRFLDQKSCIPRYRKIGQEILNLATRMGSGIKITDSQSGFRTFSSRAIEVIDFKRAGFSAESEMQFLINEHNFRVMELPIVAIYEGQVKRSPITHGLEVLGNVIALISQSRPLLFFGVPGAIILGGGIIIGVIAVRNLAVYGYLSLGYTMASMLLSIVGILAVFTGIQLNSISSILSKRKIKE